MCSPALTTISAPPSWRRAGQSASSPAPARARPERSRIGSRMACSPARPRPITSSRSPSPRAPPVRCVAGCGSSVPAASRPAPSMPRRSANCGTSLLASSPAGPSRISSTARRRWWARPRPGPGSGSTAPVFATSRPRSSGPSRRWSSRPTIRSRRPRPGVICRSPPSNWSSCTPGMSSSSARWASSTSRICSAPRSGRSMSTVTSRNRSVPSTGISWSTSTRTSTRSSSGCSMPGWAAGTTCAWSATPARPSTRSRVPRRRTSWTSPRSIPGRPSSGWSATTGPRRRWSSWPTR